VKASVGLKRLTELALRQRRQGLAQQLPPVTETLRGSLVERYVTCGNPACKCAKGERHGPVWYLTVTLGRGRTTGGIVPSEKLDQVRSWIENYHKVKDHLEKISEINRELLRRQREQQRKRQRARKS
jgi:hypothetical protein